MAAIKVGIVEDEMIIAQGIIHALKELGYETTESAISYTEALGMIANEQPDILLLDILLKGHKDGIDLAWKIKEAYDIPFIFLTANADAATVARAKEVTPDAYLVKPFSKDQLYSAIEICLNNFSSNNKKTKKEDRDSFFIKDCLFIKSGHKFQKLKIDDILYLESNGAYVIIHTLGNKILVRNTIQSYMEEIAIPHFFRVHRQFAINANHIDTLDHESLWIKGAEIPIGRSYRDGLLAFLRVS